MEDELIYQTFLNKSEDFAEFRCPSEEREPNYRGSHACSPACQPHHRSGPAPAGRHLRGHERVRHRWRNRPRESDCIGVRPCSAPTSSLRRSPNTSRPANRPSPTSAPGSRRSNATSATRIDHDGIRCRRGRIRDAEVLVNNAAANFPSLPRTCRPTWRTVVDITLNGTFFVARVPDDDTAAETPASIINVGASYAWTGGPGFAHSAAAKAGVKNMAETLAVEWGPYGIQVVGLVPGLMPHEDMTDDIQGNLVRTHDRM